MLMKRKVVTENQGGEEIENDRPGFEDEVPRLRANRGEARRPLRAKCLKETPGVGWHDSESRSQEGGWATG
jgi:hypothetical protein